MSDTKKAPRQVIEQLPEVPAETDPREEGAAPRARRFQDAASGFFSALGRRAWAYADAHPHTVLYGVVGLVLAILILWLGLWHTLVISIFVGVGATIGQVKDRDGGIYQFLSRLFGGKR